MMNTMGCTVGYGGTYEAQQSASQRFLWLCIGLLLAIIGLLIISLKSLKAALVVLVNLPLCLIGSVLGVYFYSMDNPIVSVASMVGFVTVIGFVIRNGLLLLNRYRDLQTIGVKFMDAIVKGSKERMMPIMLTSCTAIFGLIPIVLAGDRPGGELLAPLAVVQFGGLISATLLNLLVLPAIYVLVFRKKSSREEHYDCDKIISFKKGEK